MLESSLRLKVSDVDSRPARFPENEEWLNKNLRLEFATEVLNSVKFDEFELLDFVKFDEVALVLKIKVDFPGNKSEIVEFPVLLEKEVEKPVEILFGPTVTLLSTVVFEVFFTANSLDLVSFSF